MDKAIEELARSIRVTPPKPICTYGMADLAQEHFTEPEPIVCKWCGAKDIKKYGTRKDVQEYICLKCGRKFIDKDAPHLSLKGKTPAEVAGVKLPFKTWTDFVGQDK